MAYKFKVSRLDKIKIGGEVVGLVIGVTCENNPLKDNCINSASIDWTVSKEELNPWPPTRVGLKDYIVNYLKAKDNSNGQSRVDILKGRVDSPTRIYEGDITLGEDNSLVIS